MEKGNLSINSENFLPIIKKWLYTDKDIFIRELISNGCDAVNKLKKLVVMGEAEGISEDEKYFVKVVVNEQEGTIKISDNGIGMTVDEIKKYINQIAFSGASDFMEKYKEKLDEGNEIIGHFGLGFYSAFMVADKVEIDTLSYQKDAQAAKWICEGGIDYEMTESNKASRGTEITLFIGEDGKEFLTKYTLKSAIEKYCAFMPVEIFVEEIEKKEENENTENSENVENKEIEVKEEIPVNDTNPLWLKQPNDCTAEEYKAFYHKVFFDMNEPLFWIHLNMDYPFRVKGILYFPKLMHQMTTFDGEVKLYSNQVYIADNIKEVIPEFLFLLKGVIDCPDLPLNVSRSALQNDGYAKKMLGYITKKVADKLNKLFKDDRKEYEGFWDDINEFIKYGCMKEEKLYDKIKDSILYKTTNGVYRTLAEYIEHNKEKNGGKAYYTTDEKKQAQYVNMFTDQGIEILVLPNEIDKSFISFLDYGNKADIKFQRIDSDISDSLIDKKEESEDDKKVSENLNEELQNIFRGLLNNKELKVKAENLKSNNISSMMLMSEESRRLQEFKEAYKRNTGKDDMFGESPIDETLVLNKNNPLIKTVINIKDNPNPENKEYMDIICKHVYDLALLSYKTLSPEEMTEFIDRSNKILELAISDKLK